MNRIDGKEIANQMKEDLKERVGDMNTVPGLGVVLVGDDLASKLYVDLKEKSAKEIGISVQKILLPESASEREVLDTVEAFNRDVSIHGILVQLPLPDHLNIDTIIHAIHLKKDVDGFHPENETRFLSGRGGFFPVFPRAIFELVKFSGESLAGKRALIFSNSDRFGEVMSKVFERAGISAEYILSDALDNSESIERLRRADILVTAVGKPGSVTRDHVRPGAILIDGGITKVGDKVIGDVDAESLENIPGFLSPVPGGVGPVTIACLLTNVVEAAERQIAGNK